MNPFEPPPMSEPMPSWWLRYARVRPTLRVEPQRLLDDVAHAIHQTRVHLMLSNQSYWPLFRPRIKRRIVRSMVVDDQLSPFACERYWPLLWKSIGCPCPNRWDRARIQDLVDHVVHVGLLGNRVSAGLVTSDQWVNAQIFAGVQMITIEQCGVDKEEVYRGARFLEDLGCC